MSSNEPAVGYLGSDRRTLGVFWLVYGIFRLLVGICLALCSGTARVMFGALLTRVPDPYTLMSAFQIIYVGIVALAVLGALFGILAGLALMANQRAARMLALVAAFLSVSAIPFGTTLGIYTLIDLLPLRDASLRHSA
jgi:hypothetical protein